MLSRSEEDNKKNKTERIILLVLGFVLIYERTGFEDKREFTGYY